MTDRKYNGWTNYETWLANLWLGETGLNIGDELNLTGEELSSGEAAERLKDWHQEVFAADAPETGFLADLVNAGYAAVNWQEIARHAVEDREDIEEDEG